MTGVHKQSLGWTQCAAAPLADKGLRSYLRQCVARRDPKSTQFSNTDRQMDGIERNDGVIMDQALLELIEHEGQLVESEWIDEVLGSFSKAPAGGATGWKASVIMP
jgi:hypothetical protein